MIIGDIRTFAIESEVSEFSKRLSLRGLGYFVVHISGEQFGVKSPRATMMANSFDEVCRRLSEQGSHVAPFAATLDAYHLASLVQEALYGDVSTSFHLKDIAATLEERKLIWAPDGDAAFDDGAVIVQIDEETHVRLVAFRNSPSSSGGPINLQELRIASDNYYDTLRKWSEAFLAEWVVGIQRPN
jgi:hypothetical protein